MSDQLTPTTLGKILKIKHGFPFLGELFSDKGEFVVLTPGNFFEKGGFKRVFGKEKFYLGEFPSEYLCSKGDLLVAMTQQAEGLLGSTAIIPESGVYLHNQRIGLIFHDETETDKMFLYYLFMTSMVRQQIRATASGSKVKHTSPERIYDVKIWLPNHLQQRTISNILSNIDRKIALNNDIIAELEKTAKLLYDYWFVQFDFPNAEGKPYRTSGGEMIYNEQLRREIPTGWRVDKLENVLIMQRGVEPGSKSYSEHKTEDKSIPFIRVRDMGKIPPLYISEDDSLGIKCEPYDVLVSFDGSVGKVVIAMEGAFSTGIRKIKPKGDIYSDALIYFIFQSQEIQKTILKYAVGSNILHASSSIEHLMFTYEASIVNAFKTIIEPVFIKIVENQKENQELVALRDFLLPLLMNGQVAVATSKGVVFESEIVTPAVSDAQSKRASVFKRLVLSAYILDNICDEPTTGRVKFEKLLYLSEHCAQLPLHSAFQRAAAGPYDAQALHSIESQLKKQKWFKRQKIANESRAYVRMEKSPDYALYVDNNLDEQQKNIIDNLIRLFKTVRTTQCEIVATLYGAWNDFIIDGTQPSDEQIINDVLTNWHESKERIEKERWHTALTWMRENGIVPTGYGVSTKNVLKK